MFLSWGSRPKKLQLRVSWHSKRFWATMKIKMSHFSRKTKVGWWFFVDKKIKRRLTLTGKKVGCKLLIVIYFIFFLLLLRNASDRIFFLRIVFSSSFGTKLLLKCDSRYFESNAADSNQSQTDHCVVLFKFWKYQAYEKNTFEESNSVCYSLRKIWDF